MTELVISDITVRRIINKSNPEDYYYTAYIYLEGHEINGRGSEKHLALKGLLTNAYKIRDTYDPYIPLDHIKIKVADALLSADERWHHI